MTDRYYQQCPACKGHAWEYKTKPVIGDTLKVENVIHSGNPQAGEETKCQKCGAPIMQSDLVPKNLLVEQEESFI